MFKIKHKQFEDRREDDQFKLSLIFTAQQQQVSKMVNETVEKSGRMSFRKRAYQGGKQLEQAKGLEATPMIPSSTSIVGRNLELESNQNNNMIRIRTKTKTLSENDRIFTIATSAAACIALVTLLGFVCLFDGNKALLVSAQYSNPIPPSSSIQQQMAGRSLVVPIGRQQSGQQQQESSPSANVAKERHERSQKSSGASIDRFDSGEQIRPPLLRQPTTLAPLTSGSHSDKQQASGNGFSIQPAASSQESFMSPEERDQLLKQQESHYEGKSSQDSSGSDSGEGQQPWRPQQQAPSEGKEGGGGSQLQPEATNAAGSSDADDGDYEDDGSEPAHIGNKPAKAGVNLVPDNRRQSSSTGGAADGGLRRSSRPPSRPIAAAAANNVDSNDESGDPSGDYDGANDDAYFSRKANGRGGDSGGADAGGNSAPARLSQAASYNNKHHQRNNQHSSSGYGDTNRRSGPRGSAYGDDFRGNRGNQEAPGNGGESSPASNEPEGFGPGPNEAYMADKAESGGKDPDDDGAYGPGADGEPGAGPQVDDDVKFDRRSMDEHNGSNHERGPIKSNSNTNAKTSSGAGYVRPINYEENGPFSDQNNGGGGGPVEESDADEGSESSGDESAPSFAPSSQAEVMSRPSSSVATRKPNESQQANPNPVTADSRPVAASTGSQASTIGSLGKQQLQHQHQPQIVFGRQQTTQPFGLSASITQLPQPPALRNIPAPAMLAITGSNPINTLMNQQQQQQQQQQHHQHQHMKPSSQTPYNPQLNPSHVGKYFIN